MESLESKHARYFSMAATVFHIAALGCSILGGVALCPLLGYTGLLGPVGIVIFVLVLLLMLLIIFALESISRVFDFLADATVTIDDIWKRVEDTRRNVRREGQQS